MRLINIISKKETVTEGISDIVYHATSMTSALGSMQSDTLRGRDGVSMTRSLQGTYHSINRLMGVIFKLDGKSINHRYKGGPVGTENFMYDPDDEDPDDRSTLAYSGRDNGQLEDRVYTDEIKNFTNYITRAYIYMPVEHFENNDEDEFEESYRPNIAALDSVIAELNKNKIPFTFTASNKNLIAKLGAEKEDIARLAQALHDGGYELPNCIKKHYTPPLKVYTVIFTAINEEYGDVDEKVMKCKSRKLEDVIRLATEHSGTTSNDDGDVFYAYVIEDEDGRLLHEF